MPVNGKIREQRDRLGCAKPIVAPKIAFRFAVSAIR